VSELLRWETDMGPVVVEVDEREPGFASVSRSPGMEIHDVKRRFDEALEGVRGAALTALRTLGDKRLCPDELSLEFGIKLNAAAGAVIAKTSAEGHLTVKMTWAGATSPDEEDVR
jgi:hypothetical protein